MTSMIQTLLQLISLVFFASAIVLHLRCVVAIRRANLVEGLRITTYYICYLATAFCGLHLILGVEWFISNRGDQIGDSLSWGWLLYLYLLVIYTNLVPIFLRRVALDHLEKLEQSNGEG